MRGAGGTSGGVGHFFIGLVMFIVGAYLFLSHVQVTTGALSSGWGMGSRLYHANLGGWGVNVTGGMIFVPFIFGVAMVFWNSKNWIGWILTAGSMIAFFFGIVVNIRMVLMPMTAFDLIVILVLVAGGVGLFGRSLKNFS